MKFVKRHEHFTAQTYNQAFHFIRFTLQVKNKTWILLLMS